MPVKFEPLAKCATPACDTRLERKWLRDGLCDRCSKGNLPDGKRRTYPRYIILPLSPAVRKPAS